MKIDYEGAKCDPCSVKQPVKSIEETIHAVESPVNPVPTTIASAPPYTQSVTEAPRLAPLEVSSPEMYQPSKQPQVVTGEMPLECCKFLEASLYCCIKMINCIAQKNSKIFFGYKSHFKFQLFI